MVDVQKHIIRGIKELLFSNDYVVLPGFGGFVARHHFASFSANKHVLLPPGKTISFNKQLRQNDGLLIHWLASEINISQEEAAASVNEFSEYCSQVLHARKRLNLESLGFFYLDTESNVCFEPAQGENFLPESFGLAPILLTLPEDKPQEKRKLEFVDKPADTIVSKSAKQSYRNWAKPFAYILLGGSILFFTLAALSKLNKINHSLFAGLSGSSAAFIYKPVTYPELKVENIDAELKPYVVNAESLSVVELNGKHFPVTVAAKKDKTKVAHKNQSFLKKSFPVTKSSGGKFQIVFGCFSQEGNAHRLVNKLNNQNIPAQISGINNKGMHIVSCSGFSAKEEALNYLQAVKESYPTAWIKTVD